MVSVIIPNYNHASYLKQRIDSVLNQTHNDFEIIILDDNSTDKSREIIENYRNTPKVSQIIYNKENSGSTFKQWNKGVRQALGELIWIAESDDVADPCFLETLVPELNDSKVNLAFCQSNRFSADGIITGTWNDWTKDLHPTYFDKDFSMDGYEFLLTFLLHKNAIPNASAVLFKKKCFEKVGGADECLENCSDWLLWLKMLSYGSVFYSAKHLNNFRYHSKSVIAQVIKKKSYSPYDNIFKMRTYYRDFLKSSLFSFDSSRLRRLNFHNSIIDKTRHIGILIDQEEYSQALKESILHFYFPSYQKLLLRNLYLFFTKSKLFTFSKSSGHL